jgi:glycosyltransferase involved in cell wall biosynthesis
MQKLSVVIVCKNEADVIGESLKSFKRLTDDIVVFDNGSKDGTQEIVKQSGAKLFEGNWEGFGKTKNKAIGLAQYDWILSLDADEAIDAKLKKDLFQLELQDDKMVFELKFKNYFGEKWLRFGEWGTDKHIRLFNRRQVKWNDAEVHERLVLPEGYKKIKLNGFVLHKTTTSSIEYENKMKKYAALNAKKYFQQGKKSSSLKKYLAPAFSFIKNYVFKLGLLDGKEGFDCARISALYTFIKYKKLLELNRKKR